MGLRCKSKMKFFVGWWLGGPCPIDRMIFEVCFHCKSMETLGNL